MRWMPIVAGVAIASSAVSIPALTAQIDYRNLDDHHPVGTEDAYPIERYGFELLGSYEYENAQVQNQHLFQPELTYGLLANTQAGLALPLAGRTLSTGTDWGLTAPRISLLHNFNSESRSIPAFALRSDLALPIGTFGGDIAQLTLKVIATRSWGRARLHLNGAYTMGDGARGPEVGAMPKWSLSAAADRTLLRSSTLLVAELAVGQEVEDVPTELVGALGVRRQLTPTIVVDAGLRRRLTDAGPDLGLTLGVTHMFAIAGLMPSHGGR